MSVPGLGAPALAAELGPSAIRRFLARLGHAMRVRTQFILFFAAFAARTLHAAVLPSTWRRSNTAELRVALRRTIGGCLGVTLATSALLGLAMVYQALYWLGALGQEALVGPILVTLLVRELAPLLVGIILLGRSGITMLAEVAAYQRDGQMRALEAQGIGPRRLLFVPRTVAFAIASFTLGVVFVLNALLTGFVAGSLLGAVRTSLWSFLSNVLFAMREADFAVFPAKALAIGALLGAVLCFMGIYRAGRRDPFRPLGAGFVAGMLVILVTSLSLSLAI
jgi:phospholipid/cholesterol/gamma-HCH transport system permease protein